MVAVFGAVPLMLIELVYVLAVRRPQFPSLGAFAAFAAWLLLIPIGACGLLGVLQGFVVNSVELLSDRLAKQRTDQPRLSGWLYAIVSAPLVALFVSQMFSGRRAKELPFVHLRALGVGLVGLVGVYLCARVVLMARERFRIHRWGSREAALFAPLMLLVAIVLYVADQTILARLYPALHVAFAVGAFFCCQLVVALVHAGWRPQNKLLGRLFDPGVAALFLMAVVAASAFGMTRVARSEYLRFVIYEHAAIQQKLITLCVRLRLMRLPSQPVAAALVSAQPAAVKVRPGPRRADINLMLITVDALRADRLGVYGYRRGTSPKIDEWARQSVVFERGYCSTPHTSFSVTSMLTGRHVSEQGGPRSRTIAAVLRRYGYRTAGFFPPAVFFIDGDRFRAFRAARYDFEYSKLEFLDAERRIDQVAAFLDQHPKDKSFFIWVHFFEPHEPYVRHPGFAFGGRPSDLYDGEVAYVDRQVGRLIDLVRRRQPATAIALTGDHGEAFGEHHSYYHGNSLYEEQVRVPAIISVPGLPPRRVRGAVEAIDLTATLLTIADLPIPAEMEGTDLGPWLVGEDPRHLPPARFFLEDKQAVVRWPSKLIVDQRRGFRELYHLDQDPAESRNLVGERPQEAAALSAVLHPRPKEQPSVQQARPDDERSPVALMRRAERGEPEQRRSAVEALLALGAHEALPVLERLANDTDPGLAIAATVTAAAMGSARALSGLPAILARADLPPALRLAGLRAEAAAGRSSSGRCEELLGLLGAFSEYRPRREVVELLGRLRCHAAEPTLLPLLDSVRLTLVAIDALAALGGKASGVALRKVVAEAEFVTWQLAAARGLARLGDRSAAGALGALLRRSREPTVWAVAVGALAALGARPGAVPRQFRRLALGGSRRCAGGRCVATLGRCSAGSERQLVLTAIGQEPLEIRCGATLVRKIVPEAWSVGETRVLLTAAALELPPAARGPLVVQYAPATRLLWVLDAPLKARTPRSAGRSSASSGRAGPR